LFLGRMTFMHLTRQSFAFRTLYLRFLGLTIVDNLVQYGLLCYEYARTAKCGWTQFGLIPPTYENGNERITLLLPYRSYQQGWGARISIPQHSLLIYLQMELLTGDEDQPVTVCNVVLDHILHSGRPVHWARNVWRWSTSFSTIGRMNTL